MSFRKILRKMSQQKSSECSCFGEKEPCSKASGSSKGGDLSKHQYHTGGYKIWKNISLFVALPLVILQAVNALVLTKEKERPPFVKYEYLRRRTKRFPWGDGNKSLFHNPHRNALPDGYEDEMEK